MSIDSASAPPGGNSGPVDTSDPTEPLPLVAGRYRIVQVLGRGGFGQTYLALDLSESNRPVALKRLHPEKSSDLKVFELFEREAAVLRGLRHHGIPAVYDSFHGLWSGAESAFLALEYVEGPTLAQLLKDGQRPGSVELVQLFLGLVDILDYLHGRVPPVLHRDVKPSNIVLRPSGSPVLVDFGSVRSIFLGGSESGSTVVGTYGYMPFEQFMGQATPASDLYSLGATFLHVLTGRAPAEFMVDGSRIVVPADLPAPPRFQAAISRLLEPAPADRFQSAAQVREALLSPVASNLPVPIAGPSAPSYIVRLGDLGPPPRAMTAQLRRLLKRLAPGAMRLMNTDKRPSDTLGVGIVMLTVFVSIITAGIVPVVFFGMAMERRRHFRKFLRFGLQARATIQRLEPYKLPFDERLIEVHFQFEAGGQLRRGASTVLPSVAKTWQTGDEVEILYLPQEDFESVVISG